MSDGDGKQDQPVSSSSSSVWLWQSATQFVKALASDVNEFVDTLSNENSDVIDDVRHRSKLVAHQVENLLSGDLVHDVRARSQTLVDRVQDVLAQQSLSDTIWPTSREKSVDTSASPIPGSKKGLAAGAGIDEHIAWLQNNINTYLQEPGNSDSDPNIATRFQSFSDQFTLTDDDKATMLASSTTLEAFYHELVPSKATDFEFWTRYLFAIEEAKQAAALRHQLLSSVSGGDHGRSGEDLDLCWTSDNDSEEMKEPMRCDSIPEGGPGVQSHPTHDTNHNDTSWENWT